MSRLFEKITSGRTGTQKHVFIYLPHRDKTKTHERPSRLFRHHLYPCTQIKLFVRTQNNALAYILKELHASVKVGI